MNIIINDKAVPKTELLQLIKKSKIRAIRRLRKYAQIGLKDAKDVVDNLAKNPNHYDNLAFETPKVDEKGLGSSIDDLKNSQKEEASSQRKPIAGSHFLKPNRSNKLLFLGLIGFALLLIYYFIKDNM